MHKPLSPALGIPPLIKRNTLLFALSQSFIGAGTQLAYGIGPLMVIAVTGSASLAGLTVGLFGVSRFLVSYPTGKITDKFGRKPGILFGQGLTMVGSIGTGPRRRHGAVRHGRERGEPASCRRDRHVSAPHARPRARFRCHRLAGRHRAEPAGDGARRDHLAAHRPRRHRPAVADAAGSDRRWHAAGEIRASRSQADWAQSPALLPDYVRRRNRPVGRAPSSAHGSF